MLLQALLRSSSRLRLLPLRNPAALLFTRKYAARPIRCDAHMNELPIPCGPWQAWYDERQNFYNKVLLFGFIWWLFSLGMMIYTGSFYLNWACPAQPGPPSDMVEECEDEDEI